MAINTLKYAEIFQQKLDAQFSAAATSQAEGMYQISESELTTLEQDLHQLAKNSESK